MIRRPPRSTPLYSSAASDVYKRQRLDYCNGVLAGLPASQLNRLQSFRHASARLIYGARQHDHVKPLLQRFHWLSVPERVEFKLCVLTYRCLHGLGPDYISSDFVSVSDLRSRQKLCSAIYCSFGGSSYTTFHTWRSGFSCYCCQVVERTCLLYTSDAADE